MPGLTRALFSMSTLVSVLTAATFLSGGCGGSAPGNRNGSGGNGGLAAGSGGVGTGGRVGGGSGGLGGTAPGNGGTAGIGSTGGGGTAGSTPDGGAYDGPSVGVDGGGKIPLGNTQCSDGIDNDGDGRVDYLDPECTGPLDNDESSFGTGIPGDNIDACKQDCFFDGNSGMGDDGCLWQLKCDPLSSEAKCPYDSSYAQSHANECSVSASQSQGCIDHCRKLVPNGCDCFGCCAVPGLPSPIRLASTCTAANFGDPTKCPPCTQVEQCSNPCGRCEICIGKTTVPADCGAGAAGGSDGAGGAGGAGGGTGTPVCEGYPSCGPGTNTPATGCPMFSACETGCCIPVPQ